MKIIFILLIVASLKAFALELPPKCGMDPETQYQALAKKPKLSQKEQAEFLDLEAELSQLVFRGEDDGPPCIKNKVWKIDLEAIEERMASYRNGSGAIDWSLYNNPKIDKKGPAFVVQTMASQLGEGLEPLFVDSNKQSLPEEGPATTTAASLIPFLKGICTQYPDKSVRAGIRSRILRMLRAMDERKVEPANNKVDIIKDRKQIRDSITDTLNQNCS